nr:unnamed protein product [Spirometra erinaceieuropaei]
MMRQLHYGMLEHVTDDGAVSEALAVTGGVKRGGVLAPLLFNLTFVAVLIDAYDNEVLGICSAYRADGDLLNGWHMQFPTRLSTTAVHDLLFADDWASNTTTEEDMHRSMDFGLTISTDRAVVMR